MEGYLVEEAGMVPACLFYGEKGWPDFSWFPALLHAQPVPSITAAPLRRSCSARCPEVWLDVVHNMELPRLKLIVLRNAGRLVHPGGRAVRDAPAGKSSGPSQEPLLCGIGHGRSGRIAHAAAPKEKQKFPALFSVEKTIATTSNWGEIKGPRPYRPRPSLSYKNE